ncbi:AtpZ/AtpI family protein [Bythopirellula goksoeyrii]|uniref:F0F1-ATPase subunit (ATPase_gene1) n=1 Tax=Bythopirellula goksoeyrii TaxID=1400387 RepID=A0A5B9Q9I0_9BACT|nr:AtpZ/AtpI family protein [Bythopirellula goksoeyrii]QEG35694.1 Putative F0F1-ATPase subunit (ATPase_gene1) [Bythopirellula goksoeyrii]
MSWKPSTGPDAENDTRLGERDAQGDNRSATAKATEWASRIMTISLEMVLPGLAGYWLDSKLGSKGLFMLLGFAAGSFIAFKQLMAIAKKGQTKSPNSHQASSKDTTSANRSKKDEL